MSEVRRDKLTVACVLKSGGDFDPEYVLKLRNGVRSALDYKHEFVCLTDLPKESVGCKVVELVDSTLKGWWAKVELFRLSGPVIYFDLDTVITGNLDGLAEAIMEEEDCFYMLKPFRATEKFASGVMAWNGSFKETIYDKISLREMDKHQWDQRFISEKLLEDGVHIRTIQQHLEIRSYKKHCRTGLPSGTDVVCFHGKPRPHEIKSLPWIKENWK